MDFIHDKERKYYDELLYHLRKHNKSHTGLKNNEVKYIYIVENTSLKGAIKVQLSWDWISIKAITYDKLDTLHKLISIVQDQFKDKAVGFKVMSNDSVRFEDFKKVGFTYYGVTLPTKSYPPYQFGEIRNLKAYNDYNNVIIQEEEHKTYQTLFDQALNQYKETHKEDDIVEERLYVALDDDIFAGGIYLQIYQEHLYIDLLAVNESYRGQRIGSKLMEIAETIAREKRLEWIDVGTTAFQARPFYEKHGYRVILKTKDFPKGFECYTLVKELTYE